MEIKNSNAANAITGFPLTNVQTATNHRYSAPNHRTPRSKKVCLDNKIAAKTYSNTDTIRDEKAPKNAGSAGCATDAPKAGSQAADSITSNDNTNNTVDVYLLEAKQPCSIFLQVKTDIPSEILFLVLYCVGRAERAL